MEEWFADGTVCASEEAAVAVATEFIEVRLVNDGGEVVFTRWDVRPAEDRGDTDNDRITMW